MPQAQQPLSSDGKMTRTEVVISGISSVMPSCHNVMEFAEKLYDKVNLISSDNNRWNITLPELSKYHGNIPDVDRFDAQFFMVYHNLCHSMDVMTRKLLENSYQAVFDAGVNPSELSGRPIGVYVAAGLSESDKACIFSDHYFGIMGCNRSMFANRISYYLNLKGPSMLIEGDSAGFTLALEQAYHAIMSGQCEAAIVGAAKITLHPQWSFHYNKIVPANPDGKTKCYDMLADGQSISEAVNVIFIQRSKDAKRIYATLRHIKTNFSVSTNKNMFQRFGPHREPEVLTSFLREFYNEAKISPSVVEYVEGYGAAIPEVDKVELEAIDEIFCEDRITPLYVGSVTSNVGYTDTASGATGLIKVLLGYIRGQLAANINCDNPRTDVKALNEGRMRILTDHWKFNRTYVAINNFSLTGTNGHILLQGSYKSKDLTKYKSNIPNLLLVSGRQESSVQKIFDDIKSRPFDAEEVALLRNIHKIRNPKHLARGFGIFTTNKANETETLTQEVDHYDDARRPLWFVYSGMGSQWAGMGKQLLKIPVFAAAIKQCHQILQPKGIDLIKIITSPDKKIFDNILHSFIGIAAVQIGLTDVLKTVGLVPDNIIGHSVGELGCAYGDDCLTAEEMILSAYSRGLVSLETPFIKGSMAAVGIGFKQISSMVPPEIEVACHNGPGSATISGPAEAMGQFVAKLTAQGIFAKEVPCSNIAYHSRYIAEAGPGLLKYLSDVIKIPKARSERWLSTSIPKDKWNENQAKYSSAEYHTNNLLNPVLFEETCKLIPANAVLVEIAPHGLLQAILKRSLPESCHHIALTRRDHEDNALFLLQALGRIYLDGYDVDTSALYPKVEYPVSTETRPLSHLVQWIYDEKWMVCKYRNADRKYDAVYKPIISLLDEEYQFLVGNIVDGTRVFPYAASLMLVWDTMSMTIGKPQGQSSVQFKDVSFIKQPVLYDQRPLHLTISLLKGCGRFEVSYEHGVIAEGFVTMTTLLKDKVLYLKNDNSETMDLNVADVYKLFFEKGYQYNGQFQSVNGANMSLDKCKVVWKDNWVTFIEAIFQINALRQEHRGISQLQHIKRLSINIKEHIHDVNINKTEGITATVNDVYDYTRCGGLIVEHMTFKDKPTTKRQKANVKELRFVPFFKKQKLNEDTELDVLTTLYVFLQMVAENHNKNVLKVLYLGKNKLNFLEQIEDKLNTPPKIKLNVESISKFEITSSNFKTIVPDLIFIQELLSDKNVFEALYRILPRNAFIINLGGDTKDYPSTFYRIVSSSDFGNTRLELALWRPLMSNSIATISVKSTKDMELLKSTRSTLSSQQMLLILSPYPPPYGLKDLTKQWRSETVRNKVHMAMINDNNGGSEIVENTHFDLAFNIFDKGSWGGEYYIPLHEKNFKNNDYMTLSCTQPGDLNSVQWTISNDANDTGVSVTVHYAGLNTYDARRATSEITIPDCQSNGFGMDFSGVTERGDRVMGLILESAVSKRVLAQPNLLWPVPEHWNLEDAATVPMAYALSFYCLAIKLRLFKGMSVLIHGGAGALGQAAISIALGNGCKVFTTVSDIRKKRFLRKLFPDLPADHIGNSRDETFKDMVMNITKGEGCHIIISTVRGNSKEPTLACCAVSGTVLDTDQIRSRENYAYGMYNMTKSRSYVATDFSSIFTEQKSNELKKIQLLISEGIARGYVRPLTRITYAPQEVSKAVRLLAGSRHCGRVLLRMREPAVLKPSIIPTPNRVHLIICDKEDFGLQLADRLIKNGAKKLIIHCQQPSSYVEFKAALWQKNGVQVHISLNNIQTKESAATLLNNSSRLAPLEGIYVINYNNTSEKAKIKFENILINLDLASRDLCPSIRYFVIISENGLVGYKVGINRSLNNLPALILQLDNLEEYNTSGSNSNDNAALKWQNALDALEEAACAKNPIALAYAQPLRLESIVKEVAKIPGVKLDDNTNDETTLQQIGIDIGRAQELFNVLEKFHVQLSKESIPEMTVLNLKELQEKPIEEHRELTGFSRYFNYIESGELLADTVVIPSLVHSYQPRGDEFDENLTYLCILPGIEGHYDRFQMMSERLKIATLIFQPGFDIHEESVSGLALRMVNVMSKKLKIQNHFYLLGFEFGVFVAIEMATILESRGLKGTVYILGGTPEEIKATMEKELGKFDSDEIQNKLILHMYAIMNGGDHTNLERDLIKAKTWKEKVQNSLHFLKASQFTTQYILALINSVYNRIMLMRSYDFKAHQLKSKIILLRSIVPDRPNITLAKCSNVTVHALNSSLSGAPKDLRTPAIINKYLEPETLADYYSKNRCVFSFVNDTEMMEHGFLD